jgi:hypothetical protein
MSLPYRADQCLDPDSITGQLAAYGLLPEPAIDLANPAPARKRRRRRRWPAGMPVLLATPSRGGRSLTIWCPYCHREHWHGRHGADEWCGPQCGCELHTDLHGWHACTCPVGSGDGHRRAHCATDTPFRPGGYFIREVTP